MSKQQPPEWFCKGEPLIWEIPRLVYEVIKTDSVLSANDRNAVECALIHFIHCLNLSIESNRKGQHAVAICLLRQCYESLAVIEVGLLKNIEHKTPLLADWLKGNKTAGALRKTLADVIWPSYGAGLWGETWAQFMSEFTKALHPYAHYSPELQSWQLALIENSAKSEPDGAILLAGNIGLETYEANKATRITLFHILSVYILGRIANENGHLLGKIHALNALGILISRSEQLCNGKLDWHVQFWAHEFSKP